MDPDDLYEIEVDAILNKKKKRLNSKKKGNRGELELVKILNERFNTQIFARVVGSGNRWSQVQYVSKDYVGDLVVPDDFRFLIECKFGYNEIDIASLLSDGSTKINDFLSQAEKSASLVGKQPMLCWKRNRTPWLCFVRDDNIDCKYAIKYDGWTGLAFHHLLSFDDSYFYTGNK